MVGPLYLHALLVALLLLCRLMRINASLVYFTVRIFYINLASSSLVEHLSILCVGEGLIHRIEFTHFHNSIIIQWQKKEKEEACMVIMAGRDRFRSR